MQERRLRSRAARARVIGRPEERPHRVANVLVTVGAGTAAIYLWTRGAWVPGAQASALGFSLMAAGPLVLWTLLLRWPRSTLLQTLEAFWLLPVLAFGHGLLGPLVDAFNARLMDAELAQADLQLFGLHASVRLGELTPPWLTEVLLICYYSYFLWPFSLGVLLYLRRRRAEFGQFTLALAIFFLANFIGYALVPAIGPRFHLAAHYPGPLEGLWLTPFLEGLMRTPNFLRDCFPSGHTGATLLVLIFAWRFERRFFNVMLLPATGLILATLVGRFHYAVDLLVALPLVALTVGLATVLVQLEPVRSLRPIRVGRARGAPVPAGRRQPA